MTNLNMIVTFLRSLRQREDGVTALEYSLIAALIAGAIVTVVGTLGTDANTALTTLAGKF